jgi:hypothetical protein
MSDLFAEQLQALRARSLDRHLREIGSAQGPIVDLVGKRLRRAISIHGKNRFRHDEDARLRMFVPGPFQI